MTYDFFDLRLTTMPITFAHPALVFPLRKLKRKWFSLTGLIIGSMAPDFLYFLRMNGDSNFSHTKVGIFVFDLPISFLVAIVFHLWIRNILILHLPSPFDKKFFNSLSFDFIGFLKQHWFKFTISVFIGIISHLVWDDFTNPDGWIYYFAPSFFSQIIHIGTIEMHLYVLIERIGAILGIILIVWIVLIKEEEGISPVQVSPKNKFAYWAMLSIGTVTVAGIALKTGNNHGIGHIIVVAISAFLFALLLTSFINHLLKKWEE